MGNRSIHDFVVMLYCFNSIVSSEKVKPVSYTHLEFLLAVTQLPQEEQIELWKELEIDGIIKH